VPVADVRGPAEIGPTIYKDGRAIANWGYRGASGMYSTARDIYRWMTAIRDGKVLTAQSVNELWGKQVTLANGDTFYGYGWSSSYKGGIRINVGHTGFEDWLGHSSVMSLFDDGDAIVVLSNAGMSGDRSWASAMASEIRKRLRP
jgi:CubicO group peptidase (beta-lactamase class C family)